MIEGYLRRFRDITAYFSYLMIAIMTVIICYQVFSRLILGSTPAWIQEASLLLLVWIGFIGIAFGIQDNSHIQINMLVSKLPAKMQKILYGFQRLLALAFGVLMLFEGGKFAYDMRNSIISGLGLPSSFIYISVPVGAFIIIVYVIFEFFGKWDPEKINEEESE